MNPVICIAGPTASGKSAWALTLAKKYHGEVINADAIQVYRDLQIISARPTLDEMDEIPHHLFGHIDGAERYSVGRWLSEVQDIILDILARGKLPILTGGTGLYFKALTDGLASIPKVSTTLVSSYLEREGIEALRARAEKLDPKATTRVLGHDPQRLIRIVSVAEQTSRTLSEWQNDTKPIIPKRYWLGAVLNPDRAALYNRINKRFDHMIAKGALQELISLRNRDLAADLPIMKAIGISQFPTNLNDKDAVKQGIELCKRDTRRFAKRQFTWFRGQAKEWRFVENNFSKQHFEEKIIEKIH